MIGEQNADHVSSRDILRGLVCDVKDPAQAQRTQLLVDVIDRVL